MRLSNMVEAWTFRSSQYVQAAVCNVEKFLQDLDGSMFSMKINATLSNGYRPELDSSSYWMELVELTINHWLVFFGGWWILAELVYSVKSPWCLPTWSFLEKGTLPKSSIYSRSSRSTIILPWYLTRHTPMLTLTHSRSMTGQSSIAMSSKICSLICQSFWESRW